MRTKKISAASIVGERVVRYGVERDEVVQLVDTASFPVFHELFRVKILEKLGVKIDWTTGEICLAPVPESILRLFPDAPDPIGRLEGLIKVVGTGLEAMPLKTYKRGYKDGQGDPVDKEDVTRYYVANVDDEGHEELAEFPYLEKTHFMPINERGAPEDVNVIPRIYQHKFLPENHYELYGADDAVRFALWKLAQRYLDEGYEFPNGEKGQAMIIIDGYHATSGTTQEYYVILTPEVYTMPDGSEKFVWTMMTTKTRIKYANGMAVPKEGEVPKTVQTQRRMLTPAIATLLEGVV